FRGGWVGWVAYETGADAAGAPVADSDTPAAMWLRADRFIAVEHTAGRLWAVSSGEDPAWPARAGELIRDAAAAPLRPLADPPALMARGRNEPGEYAALIEQC